MRMKKLLVIAIAVVVTGSPGPSAAQGSEARFELAVQVPVAMSSQFDHTDIGIGGRFAWRPDAWIGVESEVNVYPQSFPGGVPFSKQRVEGLFGVTLGPQFDRARPFAKLRAGFLDMQEAPAPFVCLLIFPPPLACTLGTGRTLLAFDIGGGIEIFATDRTFVRVEAGDRVLRYPGPSLDRNGTARNGSFFSHDFRFAAGGGLRF